MARPRYRTLAHAADLRIAVWGDDEEELIANAVTAAMALALGPRRRPDGRLRRAIRPWPGSPAARLVRAVNEALFALYARREAAAGVEVRGTRAVLIVAPLPAGVVPELEIKAATYHDLRPRRRRGRLAAMLTLDV